MDTIDNETRSRNMSQIRSHNTAPELLVRSLLHRAGFRFRVNDKRYPGKPDIVLPKYRALIFIHGCFWHGHESCRYYRVPLSNPLFWESKINRNRERDAEVLNLLRVEGWRICIVWECALKGKVQRESIDSLIARIAGWLESDRIWLEIRS